MKQLIILLTMLLASESVFTQTVLNPPSLTNSPWATNNHNFEDTTVWAPRKQTRFYLGWQWTGPNKVTNQRLHTNSE